MDVRAFFPQNPLLKKYVSYYYFLKTDAADFETRYYSFPNTTTPVNIHKNINVKIKPYATEISGNAIQNSVLLVQGMRKLPLLVDLKGCLDKITIHFKPLGLNQFVRKSFDEVAACDSQLFTAWDDQPGYDEFIDGFYASDDYGYRIALLEEFLLSVYQPLDVNPVFEEALTMLVDFDNELSIEEVARRCQISSKTLDRFFRRHIGTSPVSFKKIARFRHSLHNKLSSDERKTLTNICYESNFYDQAYFNNVYKQIAGANPREFFKSVSRLADNNLVFRFLNQRALS